MSFFGFPRLWKTSSTPSEGADAETAETSADRPPNTSLGPAQDHARSPDESDLAPIDTTVMDSTQPANNPVSTKQEILTEPVEDCVTIDDGTVREDVKSDAQVDLEDTEAVSTPEPSSVEAILNPTSEQSHDQDISATATVHTLSTNSPSPRIVPSLTQSTNSSPEDHEYLPSLSDIRDSQDPVRLWHAFLEKHQRYLELLADVTRLRRECQHLRSTLRSGQISSPATPSVGLQDKDLFDTNPRVDGGMGSLEIMEERLQRLDDQLLSDGEDMLASSPDIPDVVHRRMPSMLAKHQIDFRGHVSTSSDVPHLEQDENLDETALDLANKVREVSKVEDQILTLQAERGRLEEALSDPKPEEESPLQLQKDIEEIDSRLSVEFDKLKIVRADLESSRTIPTTPDTEVPEDAILTETSHEGAPIPSRPLDTLHACEDTEQGPTSLADTTSPEVPTAEADDILKRTTLSTSDDERQRPVVMDASLSETNSLVQEGASDPVKEALEKELRAATAG